MQGVRKDQQMRGTTGVRPAAARRCCESGEKMREELALIPILGLAPDNICEEIPVGIPENCVQNPEGHDRRKFRLAV